MKKLKKILAGVLTLAMAMSMMTMTAFAANTYGEGQTLTAATITGETGSLTIHKYSGAESENKGTGAASDETKVPEDAEPLNGVTFSIYQVMNKTDMLKFYSGIEEDINKVNLGNAASYVTKNADGLTYSFNGDSETPHWDVTTATVGDVKGIAKASNLPLGIYVVFESKIPNSVTKTTAPFLVSIPMTTEEGTDWLYDVEVFPKNETAYAPIELEKKGIVGGDTTSADPLNGVEFELYKFKGAESENPDNFPVSNEDKWEPITKETADGEDNAGNPLGDKLKTKEGKINIESLSGGTYCFVEKSLGDNDKNGYILDRDTKYIFTVKGTTVSFPSGKTYGAVAADGKATITVYNDKPDVDKEVADRATSDWVKKDYTWVDETDYSFGDTIPYQVTVKVPANIGDLQKFILTDTPKGLVDKVDSNFKITADGTILTAGADKDYIVTSTDEGGFTVVFNTKANNVKAAGGKEIVISYNATLIAEENVDGKIDPANPNKVTLEYSNEINSDIEETTTKKIEDGAVVYAFAIRIHKVDEKNEPLDKVEFDLYREVESTVTGAQKGDAFEGAGLDASKYYVKVNGDETLKTDADGNVTKADLADGNYWLVEVKTKSGYNLLKGPVPVNLQFQYSTTWKKTEEFVNGVKTKEVYESVTITGEGTQTGDTIQEGTFLEKVINKSGFDLPETGGMGTFLFTFVGVAMMAAAVILFLTSKKKEAK